MLRFIVRRLLLLVPILLGLSIHVFGWIRALPGSPAETLLGERATPQLVEQVRHQYGLDKPLPIQYWDYLKTVSSGNLGTSITTFRPVTYEIRQRFPATFELALGAMAFAIALGIPLGFFAAKKYGSLFDQASLVGSLIGISIPIFFLGLILKYIFAVRLHWLPSIGREDILATRAHPTGFFILDAIIESDPGALWDAIKHLILPVAAGALGWIAWYSRFLRSSMLDVIHQDYLRTARAKGLPERWVLYRHALRNAVIPLVTLLALDLPYVISGAVFVEMLFAWPGMGRLFYQAAEQRDYPVLMGILIIGAGAIILSNLLADILYAYLDPRVRYE